MQQVGGFDEPARRMSGRPVVAGGRPGENGGVGGGDASEKIVTLQLGGTTLPATMLVEPRVYPGPRRKTAFDHAYHINRPVFGTDNSGRRAQVNPGANGTTLVGGGGLEGFRDRFQEGGQVVFRLPDAQVAQVAQQFVYSDVVRAGAAVGSARGSLLAPQVIGVQPAQDNRGGRPGSFQWVGPRRVGQLAKAVNETRDESQQTLGEHTFLPEAGVFVLDARGVGVFSRLLRDELTLFFDVSVEAGLPLGNRAVGPGLLSQPHPGRRRDRAGPGLSSSGLAGGRRVVAHRGVGQPIEKLVAIHGSVAVGTDGGGQGDQARQQPAGEGVGQGALLEAGERYPGKTQLFPQQAGVGVVLPVDDGRAVEGNQVVVGHDAAHHGPHLFGRVWGDQHGEGAGVGLLLQRLREWNVGCDGVTFEDGGELRNGCVCVPVAGQADDEVAPPGGRQDSGQS